MKSLAFSIMYFLNPSNQWVRHGNRFHTAWNSNRWIEGDGHRSRRFMEDGSHRGRCAPDVVGEVLLSIKAQLNDRTSLCLTFCINYRSGILEGKEVCYISE